MIQIPAHSCLDQRHGFAFHTLLSKREIISCMVKVGQILILLMHALAQIAISGSVEL